MSATQTLVTREPVNALVVKGNGDTSVAEFLARITSIVNEFEKTKPPRWHPGSLARWGESRQAKFAEIMHEFGIGANGSSAMTPTTLEQTAECLIESTCIAERDIQRKAERIHRFDFEKLLGRSGSQFRFLTKEGDGLAFRYSQSVHLHNVKMFFDVPEDNPMWFLAEINPDNSYWLSRAELHVHSKDDVKFLLE